MGWSGRAPAPPAGKGRQRQGARGAIVLRQKWSRGQVEGADIIRPARLVRFVPCVDGSGLARAFFTFAALVGAAMCSAF